MAGGANPQQTQAPQYGGGGNLSAMTTTSANMLSGQNPQQGGGAGQSPAGYNASGNLIGRGGSPIQSPPPPPQGNPNVYNQSSGAYNAALGGTQRAMGFQAPQAVASGYSAATTGSQGYDASQIAGASPIVEQNVQAGQIAGSDLSAYTNPYENQVVGQALGDIERSRLMQQNQLGASATAAGAFGGSRQGIAEAETNRAFADQAAQTASGLRQSGYANAQQLAGQDIASQMQASLANQGANLSAQGQTAGNNLASQQFNAGALNQAGQFGAGAANTASLANQNAYNQAGQFNAGAMNAASMANQQAALNANQQRLGAASQMGNLSNLGFGFGNQISDRQQAQGGMQQGMQQMLIDAARNQYQGYTDAPMNALQTNIASTGAGNMGQNTQTTKKNPGLFDYLSLGAGVFGG
jgi:hypothetical protein